MRKHHFFYLNVDEVWGEKGNDDASFFNTHKIFLDLGNVNMIGDQLKLCKKKTQNL